MRVGGDPGCCCLSRTCLTQAYLTALGSALVVSRHLKARNPSAESVRRDSIRCVQDFIDLYEVVGLGDAPAFQKLAAMLHFWADISMFGNAMGISTFFFESMQGLYARGAYDVSNKQRGRGHEAALLSQQTDVAMLHVEPSPAVYRSCGGDPVPPLPSAVVDVPTLVTCPALVSQGRCLPYGAKRLDLTVEDGFRTLIARVPLEAQQYLLQSRHATQDGERLSACLACIFASLGVHKDRLRSARASFAFTAAFDAYTFDVEGASRLDWADVRQRRRMWDAGDVSATARVRFTLHDLLPHVRWCLPQAARVVAMSRLTQ